jgi:segregation and condensation protein B
MSLKAKLEAVIYAAEEPVTLNQLAALFAADALEWKAAREAAAAEQTAEVAGLPPDAVQTLPLIEQVNEARAADPVPEVEPAANPGGEQAPLSNDVVSIGEEEAYPAIVVDDNAASAPDAASAGDAAPDPSDSALPADPEAEARRLARQKDREIKAILKQLLDELIAGYQADARGVEIREIAGGYRMATKPECHDAVRLFVKSLKPPMKLSLPALETLAVIAYKQPVTAPEVNDIRGVESAGVLGSLLARKLIATAGRKPVIGRPILYKTTKEFLLRFGLKDVSELPSMEEFEKMAASELEMEPEVVEADRAADAAEQADTAACPDAGNLAAAAFEEDAQPDLESNSPSGVEMAAADESLEAEPTEPVESTEQGRSGVEADPAGPEHPTEIQTEEPVAEAATPEPGPEQETEATLNAQENHPQDPQKE